MVYQKKPREMRVTLECQHEITYRYAMPEAGDTVFCVRCNDARIVVLTPVDGCRFLCRNCRHARAFGRNKTMMEKRAVLHHRNWPSHEIYLIEDGTVYARVAPQVETLPLQIKGIL